MQPKPASNGVSNGGSKLERLVPERFGNWRIDESIRAQIVSPDLQARLDELYSDTVTRTYVNESGDRIMLSLAYGSNQSRSLQVHKPEICYKAQGFDILRAEKRLVHVRIGDIPAMQLVARQGTRYEPITYWIRVGDRVVRGWVEQNLARISYGLKGEIPDGLLFRVSSISVDSASAFELQQNFIDQFLSAVETDDLRSFVGISAKPNRPAG
jgi:EpsI family protein